MVMKDSYSQGTFKGVIVDHCPKLKTRKFLPDLVDHASKSSSNNTVHLWRGDVKNEHWTLLPLTQKMGVTIKAVSQIMEHQDLRLSMPELDLDNTTLSLLSIDLEIKSSTFGKIPYAGTGPWIFARIDTVDLEKKVLDVVEAFINDWLIQVYRQNAAGKEAETDREKLVEIVNPRKFKEFFVKHCLEKDWSDVTCPI